MVRITNETDREHRHTLDLTPRDLPLTIGRGPGVGWQLEQAGIWDRHAELWLQKGEGFAIRSLGEALLVVNGQAVGQARLRNGDLVELGAVRLRFGFTETRQRTFRIRELSSWFAIGLLCVMQLVLVYWVLP